MDLGPESHASRAQQMLEQKSESAARTRNWGTLATKLLCTAAVIYLLLGLVAGISRISGASMQPTLENGDIVLFWRIGGYEKGDIVILHTEEEAYLVKRVIATAGDTVDIDDKAGALIVNGIREEESYVYTQTYTMGKKDIFPLTLEEGQVFVLGDNRTVSKDSREIGPIDKAQIEGKVFASFRSF